MIRTQQHFPEEVPNQGQERRHATRVGIGLPNTFSGTDRECMLTWARQADEGPFSSVGVLDRLVYDSQEPMITLALVAGVTSRVRLVTTIIAGPLRNTAVLAKEAATLDVLSGGRR